MCVVGGCPWDTISTRLIPGESEDLASRLQASRQRVGELERTLSAVSTQQKQTDKVSPGAWPAMSNLAFPSRASA